MNCIKLVAILLALVSLLALPAFAQTDAPKVVDSADLLQPDQEALLESKAVELTQRYEIDVVIVTVNSLGNKSATAYADDYFDYSGYGIGDEYSGILLLLSMEYRDWAISTCGEGITALTDYGQEQLMEDVLPYFGEDQYFAGFFAYVTELESYLLAYQNGEPIDYQPDLFDYVFYGFIALGVGAIVGAITIAVMRSGMKTVQYQYGAQEYIVDGSYQLCSQRDIYLYSHTTKVRRQTESSSTHRSSSGRSHGGSSGKF